MTLKRRLGVIGGTGLYALEGLERIAEHDLPTPFGVPSDRIIEARLGNVEVLFLARHGQGHRTPPHRINYRANVWAMKQLGVQQLLAVSAVGSMREEIRPGDVVIIDQLIDRTTSRSNTFFEDVDLVAHVSMADPIDEALADALYESAIAAGARAHKGGTYICIEGPQFSSRAESKLYRSWGVDVIGMTNLPEARLAREAELPYATLALATDYDCWHEDEADVSAGSVMDVLRANAALAQRVLRELLERLPDAATSPHSRALDSALLIPSTGVPARAAEMLGPVLARFAANQKRL